LQQLSAVSSQQKQRILNIFEKNRDKLNILTNRLDLRQTLEEYITKKNPSNQEKLNSVVKEIQRDNNDYIKVSLTNSQGIIIASTDKTLINTDYSEKAPFITGTKKHTVNTFFLDRNQLLKVYHSGPLVLKDTLLGVIIIESHVDDLIVTLTDYSGVGETGETYIAQRNAEGDFLIINALRFNKKPLTNVINQHNTKDPIYFALSRNEGIFTITTDYRNKEVFSATKYLPEVDLGLAVKIDKNEVLEPISALGNIIMLITLFSSVVVIMLGIISSQVITEPLAHLTESAKQIAAGNLSQNINITSHDEIGTLAKTFNEMSLKLHQSYSILEEKVKQRTQELEDIKHNLEDKVKERTTELEKAKQDLENKVTARTEELASKLTELERMNKIMIGRELKMLDLKNQIEELQRKLSNTTDTS
jgi:HAMP domain-containing protein